MKTSEPKSSITTSVAEVDPSATDLLANLIDEHQAARMLGVTVGALRMRRFARKPPSFYKIGGRVRYAPSDLREWIASGRRKMEG
jgi:hypothetical protein